MSAEAPGGLLVRLLGPVDVLAGGAARPVSGLRRAAVLATLALHAGQVVSTDRLVDAVWGDRAPATAANTLQNHVSYLRRLLGGRAAIVARPPGYLLDLAGAGTDVRLAERLLREGQESADPVRGAAHLRAALELWRGRPLADLTGLPWLEEQAGRLDLLGVQVRRALFEARLAAGEHETLVGDLERMVAERPLDEQVQAQLMLALYRSGRQADALAAGRGLRRVLDEELGIEPSQLVRDLETAILRQDRALDTPARRIGAAMPVPAQLPPAVGSFAGRRAELTGLDGLLPGTGAGAGAAPAAVVIGVLSGTAGVGKTTLAVHWAHRVAERFPDGQLYVNLQGFAPAGAAVAPGEAVRGFLEALGVPAERIPAELRERAGLYRSALAGKRVLVVLDNARDVEQVRPLLPGSPGCLALVTSRDQLTGLLAVEGARALTLDLLPAADARDLLVRRLGAGRVAGEPGPVSDLIAGCARLPLALTIAAARAAARPGFPLAVFAAELRDASRALDPLPGGDLATDARAVFSWSYRALTPAAARLFRLLGLHPGPDASAAAAASLAAIGVRRAAELLDELTGAHLLAEPAPGRYACHDLLRAYAAEQAIASDSADDRAAAVRRLLDHCVHSAYRAAMLIEPHLDPLRLGRVAAGAVMSEPATAAEAMAWFTAEHPALLAAVRLAADAGDARRAWPLAWTLSTFLLRRGYWAENERAQRAALDAAIRAGDAAGAARTRLALAMGCARSGRFGEAGPYLPDALRQFEAIGDQVGQARVLNLLTWLADQDQRPADAIGHALRALELYRAAGHQGQAQILNDIGYCYARLGDYQRALGYCEQGLAAVRALGERNWEAATWDSLGLIHDRLGDHARAVECYGRAIELYRELADRFNEADTLEHLGDAQRGAGDIAAARATWTRAVRIFDEIDHPGGDEVRAKLHLAAAHRSSAVPAPDATIGRV